MKKLCVLFSLLLFTVISFAQVNYDDVAVIINSNSEASIEIGNYFADKRNIPNENLIFVDCPDEEVIDTTAFINLCYQIIDYINEHGLGEKISYLVTTKGIPVNLSFGDSCLGMAGLDCRSVDNKLGLINSPWIEGFIYNNTVQNPYFEAQQNFSWDEYQMYLVSRLDGLSVDNVKSLIDKSGPNTPIVKQEAQILIDFYHPDTNIINLYTSFFQSSIDFFTENGWNLTFSPDDVLISQKQNLLVYAGVIRDTITTAPDFTWTNASFASTLWPNSNYSFYYDGSDINYNLLQLTNSGANGGGSCVNTYYFSMSYRPEIFYPRYLNDTSEKRFNLAESYYASLRTVSYQHVLIGDPKTSLDILMANTNENLAEISDIKLFPNPAENKIVVQYLGSNSKIVQLVIFNQYGQAVLKAKTIEKSEQEFDISSFQQGGYFVKITLANGQSISKKFIKL
jgi:uncharacterized protein (TIGR03790 family)